MKWRRRKALQKFLRLGLMTLLRVGRRPLFRIRLYMIYFFWKGPKVRDLYFQLFEEKDQPLCKRPRSPLWRAQTGCGRWREGTSSSQSARSLGWFKIYYQTHGGPRQLFLKKEKNKNAEISEIFFWFRNTFPAECWTWMWKIFTIDISHSHLYRPGAVDLVLLHLPLHPALG